MNLKLRVSFLKGFTLVELMIGLVIGLLATQVIMQVLSVFETQKRATIGTSDAQTNGMIGLYQIMREVQMAGFSLLPVTNSPLECTTLSYGETGVTGISPVTLSNGIAASGIAASDTLTLRYGDSQAGGVPTQITAMGAPTANDVTVLSNLGCKTGDITLIVNGTTCALSSASAVTGTTTVKLANTAAAIAGANLSCLGKWNTITYAVNNGNLERNGIPVVTGIVNLQAQYGVSSIASSNQVTQWVDASGATWAVPVSADRNRIKAVRIALVARNAKQESGNVSFACSSTTSAAPTGLCAWVGSASNPAPTVNLGVNDPNWQRYRYRIFETVIPLKNMIWARDTL